MKSNVFNIAWLIGLVAWLLVTPPSWAKDVAGAKSTQTGSGQYLFKDAFDDGKPDRWRFHDVGPKSADRGAGKGWKVAKLGDNYRLRGEGHSRATMRTGGRWTNYKLGVGVYLEKGGIHIEVRKTEKGRYFVGFRDNVIYLKKETPWRTFFDLAEVRQGLTPATWQWIEISAVGGHIQVYVDKELKLEHTDSNPLPKGRIGFETLDNSVAYVDEVEVIAASSPK